MIQTPYPELVTDLTQRLADFAAWNAGIERARREYRINPIASCGVSGCERLRAYGAMCSSHAGPKTRRVYE